MSALRERMLEDLRLRNYSASTIRAYVGAVGRLAEFFSRSPDELGPGEIRRYQLHLVDDRKVARSTFNQCVCGLRFFFGTTLGRPEAVERLRSGKRPQKLPAVLSREEVARLLGAVTQPWLRLLLRTAYAAGLRVSEVVRLQYQDFDAGRAVVHVRQGKGGKDRLVPVPARLIAEIGELGRGQAAGAWVFPGRGRGGHLSVAAVQRAFAKVVREVGLAKPVSFHSLRHSYATRCLEAGTDLVTLQRCLGHRELETTSRYIHLSQEGLRGAGNPLDEVEGEGGVTGRQGDGEKGRQGEREVGLVFGGGF